MQKFCKDEFVAYMVFEVLKFQNGLFQFLQPKKPELRAEKLLCDHTYFKNIGKYQQFFTSRNFCASKPQKPCMRQTHLYKIFALYTVVFS